MATITTTSSEIISINNLFLNYSKCKILKQIKHEYVTFATVKFNAKTLDKKEKVTFIQDVVIKYYPNTKLGSKELINEVVILNYINNNIKDSNLKVPKSLVYKIHKKKPHDHFIERIEGHDLEYWVSNVFSFENHENHAFNIVKSIANAIQVLHNNQIVHKDIKPENILLNFANNKVNIIMIDFAYSKIVTDDCMLISTKYCGTQEYISPELAIQQPFNLFANDVWSFGAMLYTLYSGHYLPAYNGNLTEHFEICRILVNELSIKSILKEILYDIFVPEKDRITMNDIVRILNSESN